MGGEVGEVGDGVILSSSSRKFAGDEDRETECACVYVRQRERERTRENDRDISPGRPVSIGTSRIKSRQ